MKKPVTPLPPPEQSRTHLSNPRLQDFLTQTSAKLIPQLSLKQDEPLLVTWHGSVLWVQTFDGQKGEWSAPSYVSAELPMLMELLPDNGH